MKPHVLDTKYTDTFTQAEYSGYLAYKFVVPEKGTIQIVVDSSHEYNIYGRRFFIYSDQNIDTAKWYKYSPDKTYSSSTGLYTSAMNVALDRGTYYFVDYYSINVAADVPFDFSLNYYASIPRPEIKSLEADGRDMTVSWGKVESADRYQLQYSSKTEFEDPFQVDIDNAAVTVDENGTIKAVKPGKAVITVSAAATEKYNAASKTVTVKVAARTAIINVRDAFAKKVKSKFNLKASTNSSGKLKYKSSNTSVAKVDAKGNVKCLKAGKCTITVSVAKNGAYSAAAEKVSITVKK